MKQKHYIVRCPATLSAIVLAPNAREAKAAAKDEFIDLLDFLEKGSDGDGAMVSGNIALGRYSVERAPEMDSEAF